MRRLPASQATETTTEHPITAKRAGSLKKSVTRAFLPLLACACSFFSGAPGSTSRIKGMRHTRPAARGEAATQP